MPKKNLKLNENKIPTKEKSKSKSEIGSRHPEVLAEKCQAENVKPKNVKPKNVKLKNVKPKVEVEKR